MATPCYRVHLANDNGAPIDTSTGTLCYSHVYTRKSGKVIPEKTVRRYFNKRYAGRMHVVKVEVYHFDGRTGALL